MRQRNDVRLSTKHTLSKLSHILPPTSFLLLTRHELLPISLAAKRSKVLGNIAHPGESKRAQDLAFAAWFAEQSASAALIWSE